MNKENHSKVGIIIASASILLVLVAVGFVIYQRRGETVFREERDFSSGNTNFEFVIFTPDVEHRVFLVTNIHYTDRYHYTLKARLFFPSGGAFEKEIVDFEHDMDTGSVTRTNDQLLWRFVAEEGLYTFELSLQEKRGSVTLQQVAIIVKKL